MLASTADHENAFVVMVFFDIFFCKPTWAWHHHFFADEHTVGAASFEIVWALASEST